MDRTRNRWPGSASAWDIGDGIRGTLRAVVTLAQCRA